MAATLGAALAGGAASGLVGGYFNERAADKMAGAQRGANRLNARMYEEAKQFASPFLSGGTNAFDALLMSFGLAPSFENSSFFKDARSQWEALPEYTKVNAGLGGIASNVMKKDPRVAWEDSQQFKDARAAFDAKYANGAQPDFSFLYNSPDYKFAFDQGNRALQQQMGARGLSRSGASTMAAQKFGQGLASQQLGNYRQGLMGTAGMGINALNSLSGSRAQFTQNAMQGAQNLGNIQGAQQMGYGNMLGSLVGAGVYGAMGGFGGGGGGSSYNALGNQFNPQRDW